jgi:hypothetical protein
MPSGFGNCGKSPLFRRTPRFVETLFHKTGVSEGFGENTFPKDRQGVVYDTIFSG